jgi:diguanylate cyclase (GGDEF)-like protein
VKAAELHAADLTVCEREPIHIPGAIQPHGALLAALLEERLVTHASANLAAILGRSAEAVLGRPLEEVVGDEACRVLLQDAVPGQVYSLRGPNRATLHLSAHRTGRHICVDIEPVRRGPGQGPPVTMLQSVLSTFRHATGHSELCQLAVRGLRTISGYDRVMAYRFGQDGHGEVIAEARAAKLEPFLGLHYPATDIPPQARQLYLRQRVGAIANSGYQPVPLIIHSALDDGIQLDLTHSALRSVSPLHCEYMRNMKTAASLTIGLATKQTLWGMLVCHHTTPRIAAPDLRAVAEMIGEVVSLLLSSLGEVEVYAQRLEREATLRALADRLASPVPLPEALAAAEAELLDLVAATGAVVRFSGTFFRLGRTPPLSDAENALAVLQARAGGEVLAIEDLGLRYPELTACTQAGSGALLLPLTPATDNAILWFRPELPRTVTWGGNPAEHAAADPMSGVISPRKSFAAWQEAIHGHSAPWADADVAIARDLRNVVAAAEADRTRAELALLRHYDSLTGLPNRSLLQDRLADVQRTPGIAVALLFLDLDRFKAVNDTMGHAAGDALLVEVAGRLLAAVGPEHLAARLGGDEFVVMCRGLDPDALARLTERIRQAIEAPFEVFGQSCNISVSIGIAVADRSGAIDLIQAADMAMYAAKKSGGNQGMMFERSLFDHTAMQFELDQDLREALKHNDQFVLQYQPLFHITGSKIRLAGFEALVRWHHPRRGWMAPGLFLPQAEKSGLVMALGKWVMAEALRQGKEFLKAHPDAKLQLAVNVSAVQLAEPGFCSNLAAMLQAEQFPAAALCLEVTESMFADTAASVVLADVRRLGVRVAIDDFGTGYSSLSSLRRLPADMIKLDRSFIEGDAGDPVFVSAVIKLAHAVGMPVVQEGIETQAQFDNALQAGVDMVQGFLLGLPLFADAATELVVSAATTSSLSSPADVQPQIVPPPTG